MRVSKRLSALFLMLIVAAGVLCMSIRVKADGPTEELSGEIEVIFNRNEADMQPYVDAFMKKHPGVTVTYTCYNDVESALKLRMEEGDYGDVVYFPSFLPSEQAAEYFEPLGDYGILNQKYNYLDQGRSYDGLVYGIPSSAYLLGIIYNKEVFDKAGISELPTTIDDFLYAMYLIDENTDALPFYTGYQEPWILSYWELFPYIEMTGSPAYKYDEFIKDVNPFREGTVHNQTMRLLYDLVEGGYTELSGEPISWWDSVIKMNSGELGCAVIGTWALYDYKHVGPNGDDIGFMPFPNNIDGKQYVTVTGNYSYAIAKNSDNKEAARAFLDFLLDDSGYAFEHDTLSVLKTDPYPEVYGDMTQTIVQNATWVSTEAYMQYDTLSTNLKLYNQDEYIRIIEAAAGITDESFEGIMDDWNARWEASRADWMMTGDEEDSAGNEAEKVVVENVTVEFSDNEKQYILQTPLLKVGYHKNMAPFSGEEEGEFVGIARDVWDMISEKTGIVMEYYGYSNSEELESALTIGELDCIAGVEKTAESTGIKFSKEYINYMDVLVRHNTKDVSSFKWYALAIGEQSKIADEAQKELFCADVGSCIESVQGMRADYTITNYYSASYYIRLNACDDLTVIPYKNNQTYHIGFAEDTNPTLIAICNKCIYSLQDGEVEIGLARHMDSVVQKVTLNTFVRANPLLCFSIVTIIFLLTILIFYQRSRAKNVQAMEAKKYKLLASLADEYFFEYDFAKERFKFDGKFSSMGFESVVKKSEHSDNKPLLTQFLEQIEPALGQNEDAQFTIVLKRENDVKQWYRVVTSVVLNQKKVPVHLIGKIMNIQKEMEEVASYQDKAHRDALTKLYNREGLAANLPREAKGVMLAVMDLDDFKKVNDTLGHGGGDYVLMYLADKLEEHMGDRSLVARYGGDEFVAVLTGVSESEAKERLEELVKSMDVNLRYAGNTHKVSISVGAVYAEEMSSFEEMFEQADQVLYRTKESGKNNYKLENM